MKNPLGVIGEHDQIIISKFFLTATSYSFCFNFFSVGRKIVTKAAGFEDNYGNTDMEELTYDYKIPEGTPSERLALLNAVRGSERAKRVFEYEDSSDVKIEMEDMEGIKFGESYKARIVLEVQTNY